MASVHAHACAQATDFLALHSGNTARYPFLLESHGAGHYDENSQNSQGRNQARYDILFAFPGAALQLQDGALSGPSSGSGLNASLNSGNDFLAALDRWFNNSCSGFEHSSESETLPFCGGWFLYLAYELAGQVEPTLELPSAPPGLPTALAVYCQGAFIRDQRHGRVYAVAETPELLRELSKDAARNPRFQPAPIPAAKVWEDPPQRYIDQVEAVRRYIRAGDVFQVNLSREWRAQLPYETQAADLYAALCRANPAPYAGLMQWQGCALASSSPERLLRLRNGIAETRPIAGTRARAGGDAPNARDTRSTSELLAHPKERAEHVMLIDLERNDLGRVCEYGSVEVDELMTVESYAHVHHIVSNVRGRLRKGTGPGAALRAVFPGGTITGCPKVRCMQIIAELEARGRGAYTGAMGYLSRDGQLDSNILIRSLVQQDQDVYLRAGGGIVADSVASKELEETRAKARGLLASLGRFT